MDEGRVGAVRRQQDHHRKNTIVLNDIITFQQNVYGCYLNRERQSMEAKLKSQEVFMKKSIVRNNILLQCLQARKQKLSESRPADKLVLGQYGGQPIHAYSKDIDARIAWMHPRLRRLRKVEKLKQKAVKLGTVIDSTTIPDKIDAIFNKPLAQDKNLERVASQQQNESKSRKQGRRQRRKSSFLKGTSSTSPSYFNRMLLKNPFINNTITRASISENDNCSRQDNDSPTKANPTIDKHDTTNASSSNSRKPFRVEDKQPNNDSKSKLDCVESSSSNNNNDHNSNNNHKVQSSERRSKSKHSSSRVEEGKIVGKTEDAPLRKISVDDKVKAPLFRRPTIILPPIKSTKEMKMHGFDERGNVRTPKE